MRNASGLRVTRYRLDSAVNYAAKQLQGICTICIRNKGRAPIRTVPFLLYRRLKVLKVDCRRRGLEFAQHIVPFADWSAMRVNLVQVRLPAALPQGASTTVRIHYHGSLAGYTETGMRYVKDSIAREFTIIRPDCYAYPVIGVPSLEASRSASLIEFNYDLRVKVPRPLVVANGGKLVDVRQDGALRTYHYRNAKPAWRIDAAIADYRKLSDPSGHLHVYCFKSDLTGGRVVLGALQQGLRLFSGWFGPLRAFDGFSVIEMPAGYGSQADRACILQTADAFRDKGSIIELYHELSHLWNVPPRDRHPCRIESEGLATFLQYLAASEFSNDPGELQRGMQRCLASVKQSVKRDPGIVEIAPIDYGKRSLTDYSYSYGALLFGQLYTVVGHESFMKTIKSIYKSYHRIGLTTDGFVHHFDNHTEENLQAFWREWLFSTTAIKRIIGSSARTTIKRALQ